MITTLLYPKRVNWYNSERREYLGAKSYYEYLNGVSKQYTDFGSINQFHIDITNTDSTHTKNVTLFTFSNDVKIVWEYYKSSENDNFYVVNGNIYYYDKDDNIIKTTGQSLQFTKKKNTVNDCLFYFTPSQVSYSADPEISTTDTEATYFSPLTFYTVKNTVDSGDMLINLTGVIPVEDIPGSRIGWSTQYGANTSPMYFDDDFDNYRSFIENGGDGTPITPLLPSDDTSTTGGGDDSDPDYNPFSDPIDFPGLPTGGSAIASGFIKVYSPTSGQLQQLAGKLWGNDFVNTIHKIMNDPMEAIISLHSVPFQIVGGGNSNIVVGNYDAEISAKTVTSQYYTLDCGNISLREHWASALDYSPYTTADIFIPFVGVRPLQIDDVMGRILNLKYNIDVLTGSAIAMLKCGDSVLYTYNTQIHTEIPYTMSSYGRLVQSIISVAGTAIGATAGGAGAVIGGGIGGALGTAMTKHSDISRGGSLGGAVGVMGDFTPYLIIHRPIQSLASDFASKKGYPSNISATLSSVSGYTVVDKVHLTGIDCTDSERDEIHALLKEGVII